jgi:hypothetical protein
MSQKVINCGKVSLIAICIGAIPTVLGFTRQGFAIADAPAKIQSTDARLDSLETNCAANFQRINWKLDQLQSVLRKP